MSSQSHVQPQLSFLEKVHLFALILFLLVTRVFPSLLVELIRTQDFSPKTLQRAFVRNIGRYGSTIPLHLTRTLQKSSGETIATACMLKSLQHDSVQLFAGDFPPSTLHFIGCSSSQRGNILLYFHGGGYVYPMTNGHFSFAELAAKAAHADLAILEYKLAPELKYPGQLAQAVAAVRFLLQDHQASQIVIGGDSAGGNMVLALLSHLRSPHPSIPALATESQPSPRLRGAFCMSPRCANDRSSPSAISNTSKDILGPKSMELFTTNWQPAMNEVWATPICGDQKFWSSIAAQRILLVAGENEVYRDDIARLAELMGATNQPGTDRQFTVCANEIHDQSVLDMGIGVDTSLSLATVLQWLKNLP